MGAIIPLVEYNNSWLISSRSQLYLSWLREGEVRGFTGWKIGRRTQLDASTSRLLPDARDPPLRLRVFHDR